MNVKTIRTLALPFLVLAMSGCNGITAPALLEGFSWVEVEDPSLVEVGIDTSVGFGDIFVLGQLLTPSPCYNLEPSFSQSGRKLTLRIRARETNANTCEEGPGGFQYTAVLRNLSRDTYELTVVHDVGGVVQEFKATLET